MTLVPAVRRLRRQLAVLLATTAVTTVVAAPSSVAAPVPTHATGVAATTYRTYVALGDSYSSGEGDPQYDLSARCHRSSHAWPQRLAAAHAGRIARIDNLACSGADTDAMIYRFKGQLPQLTAVRALHPDLVTVTIGGNDVHFADVLTWCYLLPCAWLARFWQYEITALVRSLPASYEGIRSAAPGAAVVVVGYPRLFPLPPAGLTGCPWLSTGERDALTSLAGQLDQGMAAAAAQAHVRYVSTLNVLTGHELCTGQPWINPVRAFDSGAGHPNASGQQALANAVGAALGV